MTTRELTDKPHRFRGESDGCAEIR